MNGRNRLVHIASSTPRMAKALPGMPMDGTTMVRLLRVCGFGLGDFFEPAFRALGLSENSFHVLCLLVSSESGTASPGELSQMIGTSPANMTRIIEQLIKDGWVTRSLQARDARRHIIAITPKGRKKVTDTVPRIAEPIQRAFSDLNAEELALLDKLIRKLVVSFDKGAGDMGAIT